jgi:hypothetical protein
MEKRGCRRLTQARRYSDKTKREAVGKDRKETMMNRSTRIEKENRGRRNTRRGVM